MGFIMLVFGFAFLIMKHYLIGALLILGAWFIASDEQ